MHWRIEVVIVLNCKARNEAHGDDVLPLNSPVDWVYDCLSMKW